MLLAVVLLKEEFTVLQLIGTILMLGGSFGTQLHKPVKSAAETEVVNSARKPQFKPRYLPGNPVRSRRSGSVWRGTVAGASCL